MEKWVGWLSFNIAGMAAAVSVLVMALLLLVEIAMRQFFSKSIFCAQEYTGYLLVFFTFFVLAEVLRKDRHINITAITSHLPQTVQKGLALFRALSTLALMVVIICITFNSALFSIRTGEVSDTIMETPMVIPILFIPIGAAFFALQLIVYIVGIFKKG